LAALLERIFSQQNFVAPIPARSLGCDCRFIL